MNTNTLPKVIMNVNVQMNKPEPKIKKKYWYKTYITECTLCGAGTKTKERVYIEPKPEEKIEWTQFACNSHFM